MAEKMGDFPVTSFDKMVRDGMGWYPLVNIQKAMKNDHL